MADDKSTIETTESYEPQVSGRGANKKKATKAAKKAAKKRQDSSKVKAPARTRKPRTVRPYPAVPFSQATTIGEAIHEHASGDKIRRLRLLEILNVSQTSSAAQMLITNSGKYGITTGGYTAEFLELTPTGKIACDPQAAPRAKLEARLSLAIAGIPPFKMLYDEYKGKKLAARSVMGDFLTDAKANVSDYVECVDIFITNAKDLGLIRMIGGSENLIPIEQALDELGVAPPKDSSTNTLSSANASTAPQVLGTKWDTICFYVTPIGDEGTETRNHCDPFKNHLVEPAMKELGLTVVRSDEIGTPGIIATAIMEHIKRCKLVIADLSELNANVCYEIALRHTCKLPIVQIRRKGERLPFDVGQVNTLEIDNTSIYTLIPQLETFRAAIASLARAALQNPERTSNPISVFYPSFWDNA